MTIILPIRLLNPLLLRLHERVDGAHPIFLRRTARNRGEGRGGVIYYYADLRGG
jgi:hypothetical protein